MNDNAKERKEAKLYSNGAQHFPNTFFEDLHTSLAIMLIYCTYLNKALLCNFIPFDNSSVSCPNTPISTCF